MEHEKMERNPLIWAYLFSRFVVLRTFYTFFGKKHPNAETEDFLSNEDGEGLVVVLHGYAASRNHLAYQMDTFVTHPRCCKYRLVYVPRVQYEPNSTIIESNAHVLGSIFNFCSEHPGEFIDIVGISTGGRLALSLLFALRRQETRVRFVTLASPLHGTSIVRFLPGFYQLARWTVGDTLLKEFDPEQKRAHGDLAENIASAENNRTFLHFYSTSDWVVFPPHRCTTAVGPPWAYAKALHACAHNEIFEEAMRSTELWDFLCP